MERVQFLFKLYEAGCAASFGQKSAKRAYGDAHLTPALLRELRLNHSTWVFDSEPLIAI